jgi:hypothetical protein
MPSVLPLSFGADKHAFDLIVDATFREADLHPDLWTQTKLVNLLPLVSKASHPNSSDIEAQLASLLQGTVLKTELNHALVEDREKSLRQYGSEIADQSGSFHHYFYNVLSIHPVQHPNTARLISLGMMVAGIVGMEWKLHFMRPRPVQVWPGILPVLPTPPHPSFPSNHATQAEAVSLLIQNAVGADSEAGIGKYLTALSLRIAVNRERAGLHFASDSQAGRDLGAWIVAELVKSEIVKTLLNGCKAELSQFVVT